MVKRRSKASTSDRFAIIEGKDTVGTMSIVLLTQVFLRMTYLLERASSLTNSITQ